MDSIVIAQYTLQEWLFFFLCLLFSWVAGKIVKMVLDHQGKRFKEKGRGALGLTLTAIARGIMYVFILAGIYVGFVVFLGVEEHPGVTELFLMPLLKVLLTLAIGFMAYCLVDVPNYLIEQMAVKTPSKLDDMLAPIVRKCLRLTIIIIALMQVSVILSGKDLSAVVASLGIGGLAFALAAQDTLKNFFGSLVILSDKPFELGERINVDGHDGVVEGVGLRSTRVRRLDGHLVTFPNGDLANKPVWNITKRPFIRNLFKISITYDTPPEKVREGRAILEEILKDHEGMNPEFPPRVFFNEFDAASLNYLVIVWYHPPAYWDYMEFTQRMNLEILERFNAADIDFAFPSQTIYLAGDEKRPVQFGPLQLMKDET